MAREEKYLEAALSLFAEHGFAGTSTDMIIARTGGSKATLYNHFPTKQALVAGLVDQLADAVVRPNPLSQLRDLPVSEALTRFGMALLAAVTSKHAITLMRLALGEYGRFPELAEALWDNGPAVTYGRFKRFLVERVKRGELRVPDYQLAAEHFMAGIAGHIQLKVAMGICEPPTPRESRRRVHSAVKTFLSRYAT